ETTYSILKIHFKFHSLLDNWFRYTETCEFQLLNNCSRVKHASSVNMTWDANILRLMCNCRAMSSPAVLDLLLVYPRSLFHIVYNCS
ncbi:hypothetical protein L9F63_001425, partial [Diploptera punctata]